MQHSTYYNMNLPDGPDRYNVEDFNENVRTIDEQMHNAVTNHEALEAALNAHIADKSNPHSVTKAQVGLSRVENKNSETIRSELTSSNVTTALGFTPLKQGTATPEKVSSSAGAVGTSDKGARQDHVHLIDLATGDNNGQVKIAGKNVSVKGLKGLAYKAESDINMGDFPGGSAFYYQNSEPSNVKVKTVWIQ